MPLSISAGLAGDHTGSGRLSLEICMYSDKKQVDFHGISYSCFTYAWKPGLWSSG